MMETINPRSRIGRLVCCVVCSGCLFGAGFPVVGQDQSESIDSGSTRLEDKARSVVTNQWEAFFRGLPGELRAKILAKWERQVFSAGSVAEQGNLLIQIANELAAARQFDAAARVYHSVAENEQYRPDSRSAAWCVLGDLTYRDENLSLGQKYFQNAAEVIESIPEAERTWSDQQHLLTSLAKLANCIQCVDPMSPELPILYRRLLDFEPTHGEANRSRFLTIGLDAARTLGQMDDVDEASVYWRVVEKYADSSSFGLAGQLLIMEEMTAGLYRWNDPVRISKLKKLWDDKTFQTEPGIMKIGNHILWAWFLERKDERSRMESFAEEMLERGNSLLESSPSSSGQSEQISLYASQAVVALTYSKHESSPGLRFTGLKESFRELRKDREVVGRFPGGITRDEVRTFHAAFDKVVQQIFEIRLDSDRNAIDSNRNR